MSMSENVVYTRIAMLKGKHRVKPSRLFFPSLKQAHVDFLMAQVIGVIGVAMEKNEPSNWGHPRFSLHERLDFYI